MDYHNLERLSEQIKELILMLIENRNSLQMHNQVDQFYYMQKLEELKVLHENAGEAARRFEKEYHEVFCNWQRDMLIIKELINQEVESGVKDICSSRSTDSD